MADTCGADEIKIDASTAAAVITRASLFMVLTRSGVVSGIAFLAEIAAISDDFETSATGYFGLSPRDRCAVFCGADHGGLYFWLAGVKRSNQPATRGACSGRIAIGAPEGVRGKLAVIQQIEVDLGHGRAILRLHRL